MCVVRLLFFCVSIFLFSSFSSADFTSSSSMVFLLPTSVRVESLPDKDESSFLDAEESDESCHLDIC